MEPRLERLTYRLALSVCVLLVLGAGWGRWRPSPIDVVAVRDEVTVQVAGAVATPGSYRLPWGSRVDDLVAAAGGALADADASLVAGAQVLTDGASIVVPRRGDAVGDDRVDVNRASERLLTTLPGVGPITAARIVAARPFHTLEDLLRVPGIGPHRLDDLRSWVTLGRP